MGPSGPYSLQAYRADVTAYIREAVGDGDDSNFNFNVSGISGGLVDGFALVVVYSNLDEDMRTISLLDGFSNPDGDAFALSFVEPVDTTQAGFEANLSLGIGFGFQGDVQYSTVTVEGRQLTASAGGSDDGDDFNGALLTIGGIGDSSDNPDPAALPNGNKRADDELYDLAKGNSANSTPFIANGATGVAVTTLNPSDDDNIFFAGFNVTAVVAVDTDENDAPVAVNDAVTVTEAGPPVLISVLANDFDPDDGDSIAVTSADTSELVGTLTQQADGSFSYDPDGKFNDLNDGETATTSFSYAISDGDLTSTATVTITVTGSGDDSPPVSCPTVDRDGTQEGSSSNNQVLTGPGYHNTYYFDNAAHSTGMDRITNFADDDVIVITEKLRDGNNDGIIHYGRNQVFDLSDGSSIRVDGVSDLRYLGEACDGTYVYAAANVRPDGAKEGLVVSTDILAGDLADKVGDVFLFDTALDIDLGDDEVLNFGAQDILVTTTRLADRNVNSVIGFGSNQLLDLSGGMGGPADPGQPGEVGSVALTGTNGARISALEYDGSVERDGVSYYIYSLVGSAAGVADLTFI